MNVPSLEAIRKGLLDTVQRFPFVVASGAGFTVSVMADPHDERYLYISMLGISLLLAIALMGERRGWNASLRHTVSLCGVLLLGLYFVLLGEGNLHTTEELRYVIFMFASHGLVACAPFSVRDEVAGFWQYNRVLFLRALTSALYTGVLYAGLSLAIVAVDKLFDVEIYWETYRDVGVFLLGIFNTCFFLAGVPRNFADLSAVTDYPKALKAFTQYVLLPLVLVYLVILYLYAGKILITWEWPRGWVSSLILGFAVAGILSFLLLYPIRDREGNVWIRKFNAWFYVALIPLVVMLFFSIGIRIDAYGFTELRYIVLALGIWLAGITLYFIISKHDNIKLIPISLVAVAVIISFGPWGAFEVSVRDQFGRLEELLTRERILVNGRVVPRKPPTDSKVEYEISSLLYYLDARDRLDLVRPWLADSVRAYDSYQLASYMAQSSSTEPSAPVVVPAPAPAPVPAELGPSSVLFSAIDWDVLNVAGFDYALRFRQNGGGYTSNYTIGNETITVVYNKAGTVDVRRGGQHMASFGLKPFILGLRDSVRAARGLPPSESLEVQFQSDRLTLPSNEPGAGRLLLTEVTISSEDVLVGPRFTVLLKR